MVELQHEKSDFSWLTEKWSVAVRFVGLLAKLAS